MTKDFNVVFNDDFVVSSSDIIQFDGMGDLSTTPQTITSSDGRKEIVIGTIIDPRTISLKFKVLPDEADQKIRWFTAGKELKMVHGDRYIDCVCAVRKLKYEDGLFNKPYITLNLYAGDAYFYNVSDFAKNMAGSIGLFGFPWSATVQDGFSCGYYEFNDRTIFYNDGDKPVGVDVTMTATRGAVSDPYFMNLKTNQYIAFNGLDLAQGDVLEIVTKDEHKDVLLNGVSIYPQIDRLSTFFLLKVGDNFLGFDATEGKTNMDVTLRYNAAYGSNEVY